MVDALFGGQVRARLGGMLSQPCSLQEKKGFLDAAVTDWLACRSTLLYFLKLWLSGAFQYEGHHQPLQQRGSQDIS